jgi:CHASE3 domain sensor protein
LSAIAASIQVKLNPEPQLESIRQISHELSTADNSVRFYTITRDTLDLKPYYNSINIIDSRVDKLRMECRHDSALLVQVDTISMLIEKNIVNWNKLLYLINNDNVVLFLKELSYQVNNKPEEKFKK